MISKRHKPNKRWVDKDSEFRYYLFKRFLKNNNIEMYSTNKEGKSVVAERFIRTLKNKIYKHMTAVSGDVSIHRTIKMKPVDVTSDSHAEYNEDSNKKDPNLNLVIVSEYQNSKAFLLKDILKFGQKRFLSLAKLKI